MISSYIKYCFKRQGKYHIHSPFAYDFYMKVIDDKTRYAEYELLNEQRNYFLSSTQTFTTTDFGAGAAKKGSNNYTAIVGKMAKSISHNQIQNELLFRIARYFLPNSIIELGTAFGLSCAALSLACPQAHVQTLEGCPQKASMAQQEFEKLGLTNVDVVVGNFAETLPHCLNTQGALGLVFFDGNHREDATINYFNQCFEHSNSQTIFVFDDIHWSKGMERAWETIKCDQRVALTIDLYQFGLVFFREGIEKQNFIFKTKLF